MTIDFGSILQTILAALASAFVLAISALGVWLVGQIKRWQARSDLATMKQNAKDATQAVEQLYPEFPGEVKKKMALEWGDHLNCVAGITSSSRTQDIHTESSVFTLPTPLDSVVSTLDTTGNAKTPPVEEPTTTVIPLG